MADTHFRVMGKITQLLGREALSNDFEAIDEIMRVLKPKGYLFICEPGHYRSFIIMAYITKILSFFSKFFKSYDSLLDEEKIIGLEFGIIGLPETILINKEGKIIYKHLEPLTKKVINKEIRPFLQ